MPSEHSAFSGLFIFVPLPLRQLQTKQTSHHGTIVSLKTKVPDAFIFLLTYASNRVHTFHKDQNLQNLNQI